MYIVLCFSFNFQLTLQSNFNIFHIVLRYGVGSQSTSHSSTPAPSVKCQNPLWPHQVKSLPTLAQLQRKASSKMKQPPGSRRITGCKKQMVARRGKQQAALFPILFFFFFLSTTFTQSCVHLPLQRTRRNGSKNRRPKLLRQICVGAEGKSKMLNYSSGYKSLSCADTNEHFHNVNARFFIRDRNVGPSPPTNTVNPWTEFLFLWKLEIFWRTERGCVLLASRRTPTCVHGRAGWGLLRVTDAVKNTCALACFYTTAPTPILFILNIQEKQCNGAADLQTAASSFGSDTQALISSRVLVLLIYLKMTLLSTGNTVTQKYQHASSISSLLYTPWLKFAQL